MDLLTHEDEQALLKVLHNFKEEVLNSAENLESHKLCTYLYDLASSYHRFNRSCRILGTERHLAEARLALAFATMVVIKNGLSILGVTAPEQM